MEVICPHCGKECDVPPRAKAVVCPSCSETFDVVEGAQTVARERGGEMEVSEAPTLATRRLRIYCPSCHKELTVAADHPPDLCPRCDAPLDVEEGAESAPPSGGPPEVKTAKTVVSERPSSEEKKADEEALEWMRAHFKDRYEILAFVAAGGMGAIYKARQKQPTRTVALKVMRGGGFPSRQHRRRFEREAQAVARLNHPAVVPVYDYGEVAGQPYFTMEYVEGTDLLSYARRRALGTDAICRMMVRVCDAVQYAHDYGVIHRDLKPGNIMVDELNRPRLLDFGLSRVSREAEGEQSLLTMTGDFVGTPRYMSPEQATGRPQDVDERTDVFALGVILYELIVGILPYPVEQARGLRIFEVFRDSEPVKPSALHPTIPPDLEIILLKAVHKDKQQRYASAEALAQDLENFLEDRPIRARRATLWYRLRKWAWRNRRVLTPVSISSLVIVGLVALLVFQINAKLRQMSKRQELYNKLVTMMGGMERFVDTLVPRDRWQEARWVADYAAIIGPTETDQAGLRWQVERAAERRASEALSRFNRLLRLQRYDEAHEMTSELAALSRSMFFFPNLHEALAEAEAEFPQVPWHRLRDGLAAALTERQARRRVEQFAETLPPDSDARGRLERLAELEPAVLPNPALHSKMAAVATDFPEQCLRSLREALRKDYSRGDALGRLDRFRRLLPENPHVEEARLRREELAGKPPAYWFDRHVSAFGRAMGNYDWQRAEEVIDSAAAMVEDNPGAPDREERLVELRDRLRSVIRPDTVADLGRSKILADSGNPVKELAFSPDGKHLAVGRANGTVAVWSSSNWEKLWDKKGEDGVRALCISPDGKLVAAGLQDGGICLWSADDGKRKQRWTAHSGWVSSLEFGPGAALLSADPRSAALWDPASQEVLWGPNDAAGPATIAPDGRLIAARLVGSAEAQRLGVWRAEDGARVQELGARGPLELAFHPDSRRLAAGVRMEGEEDSPVIHLWHVVSGRRLVEIAVGGPPLRALRISPDGSLLVATQGGLTQRSIGMWDAADGRELATIELESVPNGAAFSPDHRLLVTGHNNGSVSVWSVAGKGSTQPQGEERGERFD